MYLRDQSAAISNVENCMNIATNVTLGWNCKCIESEIPVSKITMNKSLWTKQDRWHAIMNRNLTQKEMIWPRASKEHTHQIWGTRNNNNLQSSKQYVHQNKVKRNDNSGHGPRPGLYYVWWEWICVYRDTISRKREIILVISGVLGGKNTNPNPIQYLEQFTSELRNRPWIAVDKLVVPS